MLVEIETTVHVRQPIPQELSVVVDMGLVLTRPKKVKIKKAVAIHILRWVKFLTWRCNENFFL